MSEEHAENHAKVLTFRPITPEDEAFLYELYASTREEEMKLVPWTKAEQEIFLKMQFSAQHNHYQTHYPDAQYSIILLDEQPVGRLYVHRREAEIRIIDITIHPQFRSRGIGTPLIEELIREGERERKSVSIYVDDFSPALRLFERLGFSKVEDNGISTLMSRRPDA